MENRYGAFFGTTEKIFIVRVAFFADQKKIYTFVV